MSVNALDSSATYKDLMELLESSMTGRLDTIVIPKPGVAADVYAVDVFVTQIERAARRPRAVGLELMIESAQGLANIDGLASASCRVEALHFGSVDLASSMKMRIGWGTAAPDYNVRGSWGDAWHASMVRVVTTARANGLRVLDGVHLTDSGDFDADPELLVEASKRALVLGFDGKWAATPTQAQLITKIFTPTPAEIAYARAATEAAQRAGNTEPTLKGRNLDPATIRDALELVELAKRLHLEE